MDFEKTIAQLVKKAGKDKFLNVEDVAKYANVDSEAYFEIERALLNEDIDILTPEDLEDDEIEDTTTPDAEEDDEDDIDLDFEEEPDDLSLSGLEVEEEELINIKTIA
ncbi:MAG: RNA polymerase subunit sigma, partial [Acholeplasmataceae bacterium]|nr:RNA polymerase subunit sigma [Acholeplasmataceae bacterium]